MLPKIVLLILWSTSSRILVLIIKSICDKLTEISLPIIFDLNLVETSSLG